MTLARFWNRRSMMAANARAGAPPIFNGKRRPFIIVRPPTRVPSTTFTNEKNGILNLDRFNGRVLLVNFWATWCPACLHELPDLDQLQRLMATDGLEVVAINLDIEGTRLARPYFQRLNIRSLPLYLDPTGHTAEAFGLREGLPWTFVIDRDGLIQGYLMGAADWSSDDGIRLLRHYLG